MAIPSEKNIELPLLLEIEAAGGKARASDLYDAVARHFPSLTQADQERRHLKSNLPIWRNRVQWARQHLVIKGEVDAPARGIWRITGKGRERLGKGGQGPSPPPPPPPTIREILERETQQLRQQLHDLLMNLDPRQFELFATKLLESVGFTDLEVTNYTGDGGIDGYGNLEMGVVRVKAAFQVKRWRQNVPRPEIDRFRGAIAGSFDQGIFITTSDFSDEAKQVSSRPGTVAIVLINGNRIVDILLEKALGVRREPLSITRIDEDFFMAFGISGEE